MEPRLKSSIKWTEIPAEFRQKIRDVFAEQFSEATKAADFLVEGRIYPNEMILRIGYLKPGRLRQTNLEASVEFTPEALAKKKKTTMDPLYLCVDAIGSVMGDLIDDLDSDSAEEIDLPRDWTGFDFDGEEVFLRYTTINSRLEQAADQLLGESGPGLVGGVVDPIEELH